MPAENRKYKTSNGDTQYTHSMSVCFVWAHLQYICECLAIYFHFYTHAQPYMLKHFLFLLFSSAAWFFFFFAFRWNFFLPNEELTKTNENWERCCVVFFHLSKCYQRNFLYCRLSTHTHTHSDWCVVNSSIWIISTLCLRWFLLSLLAVFHFCYQLKMGFWLRTLMLFPFSLFVSLYFKMKNAVQGGMLLSVCTVNGFSFAK